MKKEIKNLIDISRFYGRDISYTLGGGGNTSYKDKNLLYIKASGHSLATISEDGFAVLDRNRLSPMLSRDYSNDSSQRELEVKNDLMKSSIHPEKQLRPSVETSLHDMIHYSYVVHTHPYMVNALMCSKDVFSCTKELFGDEALLIPYTDPGFVLSKTVAAEVNKYKETYSIDPKIIFLQNHGVFVAADTIEEIKNLYDKILQKIKSRIQEEIEIEDIPATRDFKKFLNVVDSILGTGQFSDYRNNSLVNHFTSNQDTLNQIIYPFIPDGIVYCKAYPLILEAGDWMSLDVKGLKKRISNFEQKYNYFPKIILLQNGPMLSIDSTRKSAKLALDIFEDGMKISFYSNSFGGPSFMTMEQIDFIDNWEVENYRRMISAGE